MVYKNGTNGISEDTKSSSSRTSGISEDTRNIYNSNNA
jgi:hypothetical protein